MFCGIDSGRIMESCNRKMFSLALLCLMFWCAVCVTSAQNDGDNGVACDIGFVLDTSGSIRVPDYVKEKHFVSRLAKFLRFENQQYGVVQFSYKSTMDIKFTDHKNIEDFSKAVDNLQQVGSITRIDRGLMMAKDRLFTPEGGHREGVNRVLFLLTDGSQSYSTDAVDNALISRSIRYTGTEFYVLGVGRGIRRSELENIAGGKERVFLAKDFEELQSEEFISKFNMSCSAGDFTYSKVYYTWITFINKSPSEVTISVVEDTGEETQIKVQGSSELKYRQQRLLQRRPYLSVTGVRDSSVIPILNGKEGVLRFNYNAVEKMDIVTIETKGLSQSSGYQVIFFFSNRLPYTISLKCTMNGKTLNTFSVSGKRLYYVGLLNVKSPGQIVFTATDADNNVVYINGGQQKNVVVGGDKHLYRVLMHARGVPSVTLQQYTYSVTFRILNIGRSTLVFQYQNQEFQIAAKGEDIRTIKMIAEDQPASIKLYVKLANSDTRYFVKDLQPVEDGSKIMIVIGNDFHYYIPRSFKLQFENLITDYTSTVSIQIASSTISHDFPATERHRVKHIYMVYAQPPPPFQISGYYTNEGGNKKDVYINGKNTDLIGASGLSLSKDMVIYISQYPTIRKRFWGNFQSQVNSRVALRWSFNDNIRLADPIQKNDLPILPRAKPRVLLKFWNYQNLETCFITAYDTATNVPVFINGESKIEVQLHKARPRNVGTYVLTNSDYVYYSTFTITNNLKNTIILGWTLQNPNNLPLFSNAPTSYTVKPTTTKKQFTIIIVSKTQLSDDQLESVQCRFNATKFDKETRVLLNGKSELLQSVVTNKDEVQSNMVVTESEATYYIMLDISNSLDYPVTLSSFITIADLEINQEPDQSEYLIASDSNRLLTLKFKTPYYKDFANGILQLINFKGTSKQGDILLNGKKELVFDATKDKSIKMVKLTFDSSSIVPKGFIYYCKISAINTYGKQLVIMFRPTMYTNHITSAPKNFTITSSTTDSKQITYAVESTRELTNGEREGLIRIAVYDQQLNRVPQINGKTYIALDGTPGNPSNLKPTICRIQSPEEFQASIPFSVLSDAENQVVLIEWRLNGAISSGAVTSIEQSTQMELIYKEQRNHILRFTYPKSFDINSVSDLVTFRAKNRVSNKELLVNGKASYAAAGLSRDDKVHLVITDVKGQEYSTKVEVTNTLQQTIWFGWRCNNLQEPSLYPVSLTRYQLKAGESKQITISANSLKNLKDDDLASTVVFYSYYINEDGGTRVYSLINGKRSFDIDLQKDDVGVNIPLKITEQKEYQYYFSFAAVSYFSKPVTLFWQYSDSKQTTLTSESDSNFNVEGRSKNIIVFTSSKPLTWYQLRNIIYFKASVSGSGSGGGENDNQPKLLVNNNKQFNVTLLEFDENQEKERPTKLMIFEKDYANQRFSTIRFTNPLSYPITVGWRFLQPDDLIYSNDATRFTILPGQTRIIALSPWVVSQSFDMNPKDVIEWKATAQQQSMMLNNASELVTTSDDLQTQLLNSDRVEVYLSAPEEFLYTVRFTVYNELRNSIMLKWTLLADPSTIKESKSSVSPTKELAPVPAGKQNHKVGFTLTSTTVPLLMEQLNNVIKFSAVIAGDETEEVSVNGKGFILVTPSTKQNPKEILMTISEKENTFPVTLLVTNTMYKDINLNYHFQKTHPYSLLSQPTYTISGKSTKTITIYVKGPKSWSTDFNLVMSGETVDGSKALVNDDNSYVLKTLPRGGARVVITITRPDNLYYAQVEIENPLSNTAILSWSVETPDNEDDDTATVKQVSEGKTANIQPYQKRIVTIIYRGSTTTGGVSSMPQLVKVSAKNEATQEALLLNGERSISVDATKKQETSVSVTLSSYTVTEKGYQYAVKFDIGSDKIGQPCIVKWRFLVIDDSLESESPDQFRITPKSAEDQKIQVLVNSKRPIAEDELKNLIAFTVIDEESKQPLLLNGKKTFVPESVLVDSNDQKTDTPNKSNVVVIDLPKEYWYELRLDILNNAKNDAILNWEYNSQLNLRTEPASKLSYLIVPNKKFNIVINFVSTKPIDSKDLVKAILLEVVDATTNKYGGLTVNGERSRVVGITPKTNDPLSDSSSTTQDIVITDSEQQYYVNVDIENTLDKKIQLNWKVDIVGSDFKLYSTDAPITTNPNENQKVVITFRAPSHQKIPSNNSVKIFATGIDVDGSASSSTSYLVNGQRFFVPSLSTDKNNADYVKVKISSSDKENVYTASINISNPLDTDIYVHWEADQQKLPKGVTIQFPTKTEAQIEPGKSLVDTIKVKLPAGVSENVLKDAIVFKAYHGPWKNPVFINAKESLQVDLHRDGAITPSLSGDAPVVSKMTISKIGYSYVVRFSVNNTLNRPIRIDWKTRKLNQKYFTENPQFYIIQPDTKMIFMVQLRFESQLLQDAQQSLVFLSASAAVDNKHLILLNSEEEISLDGVALEPAKSLPTPVKIICSAPATMKYVRKVSFTNPTKFPVVIQWRFKKNSIYSTQSSPNKFALGPSRTVEEVISFEIADAVVDDYALANLLQLTAKNQKTGAEMLLDGKKIFRADFYPYGNEKQEATRILVAEKVFKYYAYIIVNNQYNHDVNIGWSLLNNGHTLYVQAPNQYLVKHAQQRIIRIPVLSLKKAQPDQLLSVIGISASKAGSGGEQLFINGDKMFAVNLIPGEVTNLDPQKLQVAPQGSYSRVTFNIFNSFKNEDVILYPVFYPTGDSTDADNSPEEEYVNKQPSTSKIPKEIRISRENTETLKINLKNSECLAFTAKSQTSPSKEILVNEGNRFTVGCESRNFQNPINIVVTEKDSKQAVISFTVQNKWNKDITVKHTINQHGASSSQEIKTYSVKKLDKSTFFYTSPTTGGYSKVEFIESETKLLLTLPRGDDSVSVTHQPYRQDFVVTINSASKISVTRPSFISLSVTSLINQPATLYIKNISGHIVKTIEFDQNNKNIVGEVTTPFDSYPLMHTVSGKTADGQDLYINGEVEFKMVPTTVKTSMPVFISNKGDAEYAPKTYYIDVTVRNKWRNTVSLSGPFDGKITNMTLKPGESRQQVFIEASDSQPKARFFKLIDKKVGNLIKINDGESDSITLEYSTYLKPIVIDIEDFGEARSYLSFFTLIKFVNKLNENSVVKLGGSDSTNVIYVQPQVELYYMSRQLIADGQKPATKQMSATNKYLVPVALNKHNVMQITPTLDQELITCTITLQDESQGKFKNTTFDFINILSEAVEVTVNNDDYIIIPSKMTKEINLLTVSGNTIKITAKTVEGGDQLNLNGSSAVELFSNKLKSLTFIIHSKDTKFVPSYRPRFYFAIFKNRNPQQVTIRWYNGETKDYVVQPGKVLMVREIYYSKEASPGGVSFHVFDENKKIISLNGQQKFVFKPSFYGALKWNEFVINPVSATDLKFINLAFVNLLPYTVTVRSSNNQDSWTVQPRSYIEAKWSRISGDSRVQFIITNSNGDKEYMNGFFGNYYLNIDDKEGSKRKVLYIGQKSSDVAWADLGILHINMNFTNSRTSPIKIDITVEGRRQSHTLLPGKQYNFKNVLVGNTINEEYIKTKLQFKVFDLETGDQLMMPNGMSELKVTYKLFGEGIYEAVKEIKFIDQTKHIVGVRHISLDVYNNNIAPVTLTYSTNSYGGNTSIKVPANTESIYNTRYQMSQVYEQWTVTTKELVDINGQGSVLNIPFSSDLYVMVVLNRKDNCQKYSFKMSNMFNESITVRWLMNGEQKSTTIPANSQKVFYFFVNKSFKRVGLSTVLTSTGQPIFLDGFKVYQVDLEKSKDRTIEVKDSSSPQKRFSMVEFTNTQNAPVLVKLSSPADRGVTMEPILVDSKSTKRVYIDYPDAINRLTVKAFQGDELLMVNGKFYEDLTPSSNNKLIFVNIQPQDSFSDKKPLEIDIRNNLDEPVYIHWVSNKTKKVLEIPSNDRSIANIPIAGDSQPIQLSAKTKSGQTVFINDKSQFKYAPSLKDNTRVFIQLQKDPVKTNSEQYYLFISLQNKLPKNINLFWEWAGVGYITPIAANQRQYLQLYVNKEDISTSTSYFKFIAKYEDGSTDKILLNGDRKLVLRPGRDTSYNLVVADTETESTKNEEINFKFVNKLPVPVHVLWEVDGSKRVAYVTPGSTAVISEPVTSSNKNVIVTAYEAGTTNVVRINGNREEVIEPGKEQTIQVLNGTPEPNIKYYRLFVTDNSGQNRDHILKWTVSENQESTINIPKNVFDYPITMRYKSPENVQVEAFDPTTEKQQVYLNNRLVFQPLPLTSANRGHFISIGKPISKRLYYFRMLVSNLHHKSAILKWATQSISGVEAHSRVIPPYYFNYVVFSSVEAYQMPQPVEITSYINETDTRIYTNDQQSFHVQPVRQKRPQFNYVYISTYVTAQNTTMYFNNPTSTPMTITWKTRGFKGQAQVPANTNNYRVPVTVTGGFRNQNVMIAAETTSEGEAVLVNANKYVKTRVPYSKPLVIDFPYKTIMYNNKLSTDVMVKGVPGGIMETIPANSDSKVLILMKQIPESGITFNAVNVVDNTPTTINGESQFVVKADDDIANLEIGATKIGSRQYFIKLWLTNNHTNNVALRWAEKNWQRVIELKPNFNGEIVLSFNSDEPVSITGIDVATNNFVYLNRREALMLTPSVSSRYATNVVISSEIALYDYFYRLIVNNERNTDVIIALKSPKETTKSNVPALNFKYSINTPLFNVEVGPKQPIQILAFMRDGTPLYVNQRESVELLPTLNDDEATIVNVGKEIPRRIYYYAIKVSSPSGRDVIFRYKLPDGVPRITRVPAPTENRKGYYSVIIPYKSLVRPSPVVFYAYDEQSDKPMLINGAKSFTVLPNNDQEKQHAVYVTDRDDSSTSATGQDQYKFLYKVRVFNSNNEKVKLTWTVNKTPRETFLPPYTNQEISFEAMQPTDVALPIEVQASSENGDKLQINQLPVYYLKPLDDKAATPVVYIGNIGNMIVYVNNKVSVDVDIIRIVDNKTKVFKVKASTLQQQIRMSKSDNGESNIIFKAVSSATQRPLALNKQLELTVDPNSLKTGASGEIVLNLDVSSIAVYYTVAIRNRELYPVTVTWNVGNRGAFRTISGNSVQKIAIQQTDPQSDKPEPISFRCYRPYRGQQLAMFINNKQSLLVDPVYDQNTVVNALVSSKLLPKKSKFIRLDIMNRAKEAVALYWSQDKNGGIDLLKDDKKLITAGSGNEKQRVQLTFPYEINDLVKLIAVTYKDRTPLSMNSRLQLFITPVEEESIVNVVIVRKDTRVYNTYFLHLEMQNHNENPIQIRYKQAGETKERFMNVQARYQRWFYLAFERVKGQPMSVQFRVFDLVKSRYLSVNNQPMFLYQPASAYTTKRLIVGTTIPSKIYQRRTFKENEFGYPYFLGIHAWNRGDVEVRLTWYERATRQRRYLAIPARSFREFTYVMRSKSYVTPWIRIHAQKITKNGVTYRPLIDGFKSMDVLRLTRDKQKTFLFIDHKKQKDVTHFRYGIRFENMASHNVLFKWNEGSQQRTQYVKPLSASTYYGVWSIPTNQMQEDNNKKNPMLNIEAFNQATNERVLLNGEESTKFWLSPKTTRMRSVYVEPDSSSLRLRTYFTGYDLTNLRNQPVRLEWSERKEQRSVVVPAQGSQSYDSSIVSSVQPPNIVVTAYDKKTNERIQLYGQQSFTFQPSQHLGRHVIVIGESENSDDTTTSKTKLTTYQITFKLKNVADVPLSLKWKLNNRENSLDVAVGASLRHTITIKSTAKLPPVEFQVFKKGSDDLGQIDGKQIVKVQPMEKPLVSLWKLTYGDFLPGEIQAAQVQCQQVLDIAVLLDSSGTMRSAYQHAKEFIKIFADYHHMGPNSTHVGVITFSEVTTTHIPLRHHQEHAAFNKDIDRIRFEGHRTRLGSAFKKAYEMLYSDENSGRDGAKKIVLLLTDGRHNAADITKAELEEAVQEEEGLLRRGAKVSAIGLYGSYEPDEALLEKLTGSKDRVHIVTNYEQLYSQSFVDALIDDSCHP